MKGRTGDSMEAWITFVEGDEIFEGQPSENPWETLLIMGRRMKSVFRLAARRTICPRGLPAGIRAGE